MIDRRRISCVEPCFPSRVMLGARAVLVACAVALVACLSGCGYTTKPTFRTDVHTVAVPIFQNRTFMRGAEFDLTEALIKEISLRTPYKIADQAQADTVLQGTIVRLDPNRVSVRREGGLPQEMETRLVVDFEWIGRDGKVIRQRQGIEAIGRYVPARGAGEVYELSQHEAVARMAERVVAAMRDDW